MIPTYLEFIRFQDKRLLPFFYLILSVVLGFYWKNNEYVITQHDAWFISVILAIALFNLIYDMKSYWIYSFMIKRINFDCFVGQSYPKALLFLSRPTVVSIISIFVYWLIIKCCLLLPSMTYSVICLFIVSPLYAFLVFRTLRPLYIRQIINSGTNGVVYKNLYEYVGYFILLTITLNVLSISPLKANPDFTLSEGYFSAKLMVAMLILCAIVLGINLVFARLPKRYIFLGRVFLKEIDFFFSKQIPFNSLYEKSLLVRMLLLFVVQFVWILLVSVMLTLLNWNVIFEIYFLLCFLPCIGYFFLHVYWFWHNEFMMSCDMYFRYEEFKKRDPLHIKWGI